MRSIDVQVSGSLTDPDGTIYLLDPKASSWSFDGNCSGRDLHIIRRLTYGGHCFAR